MQRLILAAAVLGALVVAPRLARADDHFDSTGWTLLGEQTVDGQHDTDTIAVGKHEGRFTKLMLVVLDADLRLDAMNVTFGNGQTFAPDVAQSYEEGSRTRSIDLPGDARGITSITLTYGARDDHGKKHGRHRDQTPARVQVWGLLAQETQPPPSPPPAPPAAWDSTGWTVLATKAVTARRGSLTFRVARNLPFDHLSLVLRGGRIHITALAITYRQGPRGKVVVDQDLDDTHNQRTIPVDGAARAIRAITVSYTSRGNSKRASIEVWGRLGDDSAAPPAWSFDSNGWTMLGEQTVDGKHDRDYVEVGRDAGKFSTLTLVVLDGDIEMNGMVVHLRHGDDVVPQLRYFFKDGQRSRQIELGDHAVGIKNIELSYGTTRGGGHARVQIWGR